MKTDSVSLNVADGRGSGRVVPACQVRTYWAQAVRMAPVYMDRWSGTEEVWEFPVVVPAGPGETKRADLAARQMAGDCLEFLGISLKPADIDEDDFEF